MEQWKKCDKGCTICNGEFCDYATATCCQCGEEFPVWNLLRVNGKYQCLKCYVEDNEVEMLACMPAE